MKFVRIFISGACFSVFGLICFCGNFIFVPIILFRLQRFKRVQNFARFLVFYSWGFFIKIIKILGYLSYEFKGLSKDLTPCRLIIANHPSLLDVVFFLSHIKGLNCVVKSSLRKNFFLAPAIIASNYISNENEEKMLESCQKVLENGESLLIFPEGTRTKEKIIFHKIASYLAIKSAKSLECVFITVSPRALQKGRKWFDAPKERVKYSLETKEILDIMSFCKNDKNPIRVRNLHKILQENYQKEFK